MKTALLSLMVLISTMGINGVSLDSGTQEISVNEEQSIELFFMYGNEEGTYWLDPKAEYENVIWVDYESLIEWGIDFKELHHGNKKVGLFDETGWELFEIIN